MARKNEIAEGIIIQNNNSKELFIVLALVSINDSPDNIPSIAEHNMKSFQCKVQALDSQHTYKYDGKQKFVTERELEREYEVIGWMRSPERNMAEHVLKESMRLKDELNGLQQDIISVGDVIQCALFAYGIKEEDYILVGQVKSLPNRCDDTTRPSAKFVVTKVEGNFNTTVYAKRLRVNGEYDPNEELIRFGLGDIPNNEISKSQICVVDKMRHVPETFKKM